MWLPVLRSHTYYGCYQLRAWQRWWLKPKKKMIVLASISFIHSLHSFIVWGCLLPAAKDTHAERRQHDLMVFSDVPFLIPLCRTYIIYNCARDLTILVDLSISWLHPPCKGGGFRITRAFNYSWRLTFISH